MRHSFGSRSGAAAVRTRRSNRVGLTLVEVIVALSILGGVLLGLGMFSVRLSQSTSAARMRVMAAELASSQLEKVKDTPTYARIDTAYVKTEALTGAYAGYTRQTWVDHILAPPGSPADTTDFKIVTVQVSNPQMSSVVRKTTVIAPY